MTLRRWVALPLSSWASGLFAAAFVVGVLLPFQAIPPLVTTPWLGLTDDKLVLLVLVVAWVFIGLSRQRATQQGLETIVPARGEWQLLLPSLVFIVVTLLSARFAAPEYAAEALRFVARLFAAAFLMLVAMRLGRDERHALGLLWAVALGGGLSALLGIGEALHWPFLTPVLALFKVAPTRVGGELRVSASFQYATIAAMYFEMVVPLAIGLAASARRRWTQGLALAIALACTASVVLSLTRAGMLTLAAIFAVLLLAGCVRKALRRVLLPTLASAALLVGGTILLLAHDPVFDLRLQTESDADWYGAAYSAPASLNLRAGQMSIIDLDVRNEGRITWTSSGPHPFALGYRWLTDDGNGVLDIPPVEVPLTHDVDPGETIHLQANLLVPDLPAGGYRLDWGMLQRDVLQFYERGWADAETQVALGSGGALGAMPAVSPRDDGEAPWVVGRMDLWGAAARLIAAHPILGVGPDNFRHYYGAELGLEGWDERIQANNLYLEVLSDLGVLGLASFAWVVAGPLVASVRGARGAGRSSYVALGLGLAIVAFLLHGLLDSFLAFNPTAWLFWMLLGVAVSLGKTQKPQVSGRW